jgi:hypothetical protein
MINVTYLYLHLCIQVLNVDGVTGGFNFQNAWSGGYIAGTNIGELASSSRISSKERKVTIGL